jgi:hypothetical protein
MVIIMGEKKYTLCTRVLKNHLFITLLHNISHFIAGSMLDYLIDHPETVGIDMELPLWASQVELYTVLRIRDVYPGSRILIFYPSRIPNPTTVAKEEGEKNFCSTFFL